MRLNDALYNWLQIQVVWKARPQDRAAEDTARFFHTILTEDHGVEDLRVTLEDGMYVLSYRHEGKEHTRRYHREQAEELLRSIEDPKMSRSFGCDLGED